MSAKRGCSYKDKISFDDFIRWMKFSSATCLHPVPHCYQLDWFVDSNGNVLFDFIGRFETIDKDWETISRKLGIAAPLLRLNANLRDKHYSEYYSDVTRKIVADRFEPPRVSWRPFGLSAGH